MRAAQVIPVILAGVVAGSLQGCDSTGPTPQAEVRVTASTPTSLSGTVGADIQPAPSVRVTDERDRPLAGVAVTFKVVSGGGTIGGGTVMTQADGSATLAKWTLGPTPGIQTLAAGTGGKADVVFTALAATGPVAQITASSGSDQLAGVGQPLEQPLVALAADAFGNPVSGIPIVFRVTAGGGSIDGDTVRTDALGRATAEQWTLGAQAGIQQVTAASGTVQGVFRAFAAPTPGPLQGQIAFVSYADPDLDIAVVNADGSGFTRFSYPGLATQPAWSPDGSRLAFASDVLVGGVEAVRIGLLPADGSNELWLTQGPIDLSPAWSPDGTAIAFTTWANGKPYVASLSLADSRVTMLVEAAGDGQPSWSPDGRKLAFVSALGGGYKDIYTASTDGSGPTRLTNGLVAYHPAWSPDGSMIAFVHGNIARGDTAVRVAVMSADGVFLKDLASAGPITLGENAGSLAWSPDGSGIAFSFFGCEPPATGCLERSVKYVSLDGSRLETLIPDAQSPTWRP